MSARDPRPPRATVRPPRRQDDSGSFRSLPAGRPTISSSQVVRQRATRARRPSATSKSLTSAGRHQVVDDALPAAIHRLDLICRVTTILAEMLGGQRGFAIVHLALVE